MRRILLFVSGIIAGSGAGAALSYLFAPKSGDEMRQNIKTHFKQIQARSTLAGEAYESELRRELAELTSQNLPVEEN